MNNGKTSNSYKFSVCSKGKHQDCVGALIATKTDEMGSYDMPAKCSCECHQPSLFKLIERTQGDLF